MLRTIISIYKVVFLGCCLVMLMAALALGLFIAIEGKTPSERWSGLSLMIGGAFFTILMMGNFALILENNELLRRIVENTEDPKVKENTTYLHISPNRSEPTLRRKEPTI